MAEYKKKKVKKTPLSKPEKTSKPERIEMRESRTRRKKIRVAPTRPESFRVHSGKKNRVKILALSLAALMIVVASVYLIVLAFHPIGVIEYISSAYTRIGSGNGYDVTLGGDEIFDIKTAEGHYYSLTKTDVSCYNTNGKLISEIVHGFTSPVLKTSETRSLIYGQGEKALRIYNYNKEIISMKFDNSVLCADIADNGNFAVATYADSYDSMVKVFNKKGDTVYEWYCADGTVNALNLTSDGKQIIVSTFTVSDGVINSKLHLLNFSSADAVKTFEFTGELAYNIYRVSKNRIYAIFESNIKYIDLKSGAVVSDSTDYSYKLAKQNGSQLLLLSSLSANSEKSSVTIYNKKGKLATEFTLDMSVDDICFTNEYVYVLSNSTVHKADKNGNILSSIEVTFDIKRIQSVLDRFVITFSSTSISKIQL